MSPLEFMQRLAALVPRPGLRLIRFHGVLALNAKLRALMVPQGPPAQAQPASEAAAAKCDIESEVEPVQALPQRIGRARLLKRIFAIDMEHCPNCGGGELKIIAAILERPVIERILTHLGLDPRGRAREAGQDQSRLQPRRPLQTSWPALQRQAAAGARLSAVSARSHRIRGNPEGVAARAVVNGPGTAESAPVRRHDRQIQAPQAVAGLSPLDPRATRPILRLKLLARPAAVTKCRRLDPGMLILYGGNWRGGWHEGVRRQVRGPQGVLSCFDRMLLRGYLPIMSSWSMAQLLQAHEIDCASVKPFLLSNAERVKTHAQTMAREHGRPFEY